VDELAADLDLEVARVALVFLGRDRDVVPKLGLDYLRQLRAVLPVPSASAVLYADVDRHVRES